MWLWMWERRDGDEMRWDQMREKAGKGREEGVVRTWKEKGRGGKREGEGKENLPRPSIPSPIEIRVPIHSIRINLHVISWIIRNPSSKPTIQIKPITRRHNDLISRFRQRLDIRRPIIPRLQNNVFGDTVCMWCGDGNILPHNELSVGIPRTIREDRDRVVDPMLQQIIVRS